MNCKINVMDILKNTKYNELNQYEHDKKLKYYDIYSKEESNLKKNNVFILAGEHPREMISVELVFHFIKLLCKEKNK
jgi:hypothetical protein